jgi:3-hydroxyisobutyrate dehydrogenase
MPADLKVGFVGIGIMGAPMAANTLKAGFAVAVWNRTKSKCARLAEQGATVCDSPAEVAEGSDVVVTMVSDTPDVEAVLFGAGGVAAGVRPGSVVIDMSTISPRATVEFGARLKKQSVDMLDAPVSGGEVGAVAGTLSIMVGGEEPVFERCLPVLQAMGRNIVYAGPAGNGQKTKLVNQVVGSLNLLAAVEGLRLAAAAGLDVEKTIAAVGAGAAGSWMLSNLGPKIARGDFSPGFFVRLQHKDLRLASELLAECGLDAPGTELMCRIFGDAVAKGLGELGNQGIARLWDC